MNKAKYFFLILLIPVIYFFLPESVNHEKDPKKYALGKNIFLGKGNCAACHSLSDAGSVGQIGPNLNILQPSYKRVEHSVTYGLGLMPAYGDQLTKKEIKAIAHYVFFSTKD